MTHTVTTHTVTTHTVKSQDVTKSRRLARFSMVGAIGIVVQLAVLWLLTAIKTNYLVATVVAVESTILHNFIWHRLFTWPERQRSLDKTISALLRFNLSNGLLSLAGNVLLMRLFNGKFHLPLLPANLLSIAICALANFAISDRWVFTAAGASTTWSQPAIAPASAPGCVAQREGKSVPLLPPAPNPSRSVEPAKTATAPTIRRALHRVHALAQEGCDIRHRLRYSLSITEQR